MKQIFIYIFTGLGCLALIAGLWSAGWAAYEYSVNREARIQRDSVNFQQGRRDEITRLGVDIATIDAQLTGENLGSQRAQIEAQRKAILVQICNLAADLKGDITPAVQSIIKGC